MLVSFNPSSECKAFCWSLRVYIIMFSSRFLMCCFILSYGGIIIIKVYNVILKALFYSASF